MVASPCFCWNPSGGYSFEVVVWSLPGEGHLSVPLGSGGGPPWVGTPTETREGALHTAAGFGPPGATASLTFFLPPGAASSWLSQAVAVVPWPCLVGGWGPSGGHSVPTAGLVPRIAFQPEPPNGKCHVPV